MKLCHYEPHRPRPPTSTRVPSRERSLSDDAESVPPAARIRHRRPPPRHRPMSSLRSPHRGTSPRLRSPRRSPKRPPRHKLANTAPAFSGALPAFANPRRGCVPRRRRRSCAHRADSVLRTRLDAPGPPREIRAPPPPVPVKPSCALEATPSPRPPLSLTLSVPPSPRPPLSSPTLCPSV